MPPSHKGLHELFTYPLMSAIFDRAHGEWARTSVVSGPISYTSPNKPEPLTRSRKRCWSSRRGYRQGDDA